MTRWEEDKRRVDKYLYEIKGILGQQLIGEPPIEEDQERNTDLIILKMEAVRIACRIRKFIYWLKYPNEFTIREGRPSGIKTELAKIIEGWGDYLFYGFSDELESRLHAWNLIDLKVFRLEFNRKLASLPANILPGIPQKNGDLSSTFRAFKIKEYSQRLIIASSSPEIIVPTENLHVKDDHEDLQKVSSHQKGFNFLFQ